MRYRKTIINISLNNKIARKSRIARKRKEYRGPKGANEGEVRLCGDMGINFFDAAEILLNQPGIKAQLAGITRRLMASGTMLDPLPLYTEIGSTD